MNISFLPIKAYRSISLSGTSGKLVILNISVQLWQIANQRPLFSPASLKYFGGLKVETLNMLLAKLTCIYLSVQFSSVQFSPVAQSCPTLCTPMNRSTPGLPVYHQLPESTQNYVHCVSNAIQPSHPLLSLSPPALNLSQHQCLFK